MAIKTMNKVASHINEMQKIHEEFGAVFDQLIAEQTGEKKEVGTRSGQCPPQGRAAGLKWPDYSALAGCRVASSQPGFRRKDGVGCGVWGDCALRLGSSECPGSCLLGENRTPGALFSSGCGRMTQNPASGIANLHTCPGGRGGIDPPGGLRLRR